MATVLWDRKGVLMVEFMQQGTTIMSEVYWETLKTTAWNHSEQKQGMLLQDNARLHTAACTRAC
jgi:hypothetical protein